jgi:hypothetical protein
VHFISPRQINADEQYLHCLTIPPAPSMQKPHSPIPSRHGVPLC